MKIWCMHRIKLNNFKNDFYPCYMLYFCAGAGLRSLVCIRFLLFCTQVAAPRRFSLVCFRLLSARNNVERANQVNRELLEAVNSTGKLFISHTVCLNYPLHHQEMSLCKLTSYFWFWNKCLGPITQVCIAVCCGGAIDWREACGWSLEDFTRKGFFAAE